MNSVLDQLNLTPQERRIVVVIAVVVFVVLNLLLVWPHFKDLGQVQRQLAETRRTIQQWNKQITLDLDPTNGYQKQLAGLEKHAGGAIGGSKQVALQTTVQSNARRTGVIFDEIKPVTSGTPDTNAFFEEQSIRISFESPETNLVNFLYDAGNDPAMIRVRELNLQPADANRYKLKGYAILTANYARQAPKAATPAPAPKAPPQAIPRPGANGGAAVPLPHPPKPLH